MRVILLAGGKSQRMGKDKLFLPLHDKPLILYMIEKLLKNNFSISIIASSSSYQKIKEIVINNQLEKVSIHEDIFKDLGPIGGIYSGMFYSKDPYVFILACDLPFFNPILMRAMEVELLENDIVVPRMDKGFEPLFCIYSQKCQPVLHKMIKENDLKISNCYIKLTKRVFPPEEIKEYDPNLLSFVNINTEMDYKTILSLSI